MYVIYHTAFNQTFYNDVWYLENFTLSLCGIFQVKMLNIFGEKKKGNVLKFYIFCDKLENRDNVMLKWFSFRNCLWYSLWLKVS